MKAMPRGKVIRDILSSKTPLRAIPTSLASFMMALPLLATNARAEVPFGRNLITCKEGRFLLSGCTVGEGILPVVSDLGDAEADFTIDYTYACGGHATRFGVRAGAGEAAFVMGPALSSLKVTGLLPLKVVDLDPSASGRAKLSKGCELKVLSVKVFPSDGTLAAWANEARLTGELLDAAVDTLLLARNVERLLDFDRSELASVRTILEDYIDAELAAAGVTRPFGDFLDPATGRVRARDAMSPSLRDEWDDLSFRFGLLGSLVTLWDGAIDAAAARPPAHSPLDLARAGRSLAGPLSDHYALRAKAVAARAAGLLDRAARYLDLANEERARSLKELRALLDGALNAHPSLRP